MPGYGETVTLITRRVTGRDDRGNDVMGLVPVDVPNVVVWPAGSSEQLNAQDLGTNELELLLPPPYSAELIDAIKVYGDTYEVDGQPGQFQNPFTGMNPGKLVRLRKATG